MPLYNAAMISLDHNFIEPILRLKFQEATYQGICLLFTDGPAHLPQRLAILAATLQLLRKICHRHPPAIWLLLFQNTTHGVISGVGLCPPNPRKIWQKELSVRNYPLF